jgi:hypothetical protein
VINQGLGRFTEGGISLEDLPMGSVVYVGRGSFRMEAWPAANDSEHAIVEAAPQPVVGVVTAPYEVTPPVITYVGHPGDSARDALLSCAPAEPAMPAALFGSQVDVPLLPPPTGEVTVVHRHGVRISRAALGGWGALLFACGVAISGGLHHLLAPGPAPALAVARVKTSAPAPTKVVENELVIEADIHANAMAPKTIALAKPVTIRLSKPAAPRRPALAARSATSTSTAKPVARWVDPFAE